MDRKDNNGRNRTSSFKDKHGYQEVMLRSDLVLKTITACLAQVPALFWYHCEFHSSYFMTPFSSIQLLVLAMSSSVFCLWNIDHSQTQQAGELWEVSDHDEGTKRTELMSAGSRSFWAEAADMPHLKMRNKTKQKESVEI